MGIKYKKIMASEFLRFRGSSKFYLICIECTAFHEFASICSCIVVALSFIFTWVHSINAKDENSKRRKHWLLLGCKLANVTLTILGFFQLFIADMYFDIADDIKDYAKEKNIPLK